MKKILFAALILAQASSALASNFDMVFASSFGGASKFFSSKMIETTWRFGGAETVSGKPCSLLVSLNSYGIGTPYMTFKLSSFPAGSPVNVNDVKTVSEVQIGIRALSSTKTELYDSNPRFEEKLCGQSNVVTENFDVTEISNCDRVMQIRFDLGKPSSVGAGAFTCELN